MGFGCGLGVTTCDCMGVLRWWDGHYSFYPEVVVVNSLEIHWLLPAPRTTSLCSVKRLDSMDILTQCQADVC